MPRPPRRPAAPPEEDEAPTRGAGSRRARAAADDPDPIEEQPSLAGLGIAGISRRRLVTFAAAALGLWIAIGFAGQATEAARAADRASQELATNEALAARIAGLEDELNLVVQQRWFLQEARAYALGTTGERPFRLDPAAPSLAPDAPGSPERGLGAETAATSPLDSWLDVLFGPAPGG